jgi:hypothetical protein
MGYLKSEYKCDNCSVTFEVEGGLGGGGPLVGVDIHISGIPFGIRPKKGERKKKFRSQMLCLDCFDLYENLWKNNERKKSK